MASSQQTLLHKRLQCFVDFIAPEKDEQPKIKELFQQIANRVRKHATEEGYTVASIHYAGSYAKRTGLGTAHGKGAYQLAAAKQRPNGLSHPPR